MSDAAPATVLANAKLTLSLRITGVRDDGYHTIDAEMVSLALADKLTITGNGNGNKLTADGPFAAGMPLDDSNLITKALRFVNRTASVRVSKQIPHGGGLGGGSSNAAAILRWAGYDNVAAAAKLGADVPFCLVGGRARVLGIGEIVEPLPFERLLITLIIPPLSVSTPAVFSAWDRLVSERTRSHTSYGNELEPAALLTEPLLRHWRDRIEEASGQAPTLAGSGATWFLRGHHELAGALPEAVVVHTETVPSAG